MKMKILIIYTDEAGLVLLCGPGGGECIGIHLSWEPNLTVFKY